MVLLVLMMTLSLWQWRQKQPPVALATGVIIAPLHLRALAFFVDAILPYVVVLFIYQGIDGGGYFDMAISWSQIFSHPEEAFKTTSLLAFLGIYLGHVTVGELFFRRSLGKSLVGLHVQMMDGRPPSVGAVLVRNLVRVPETAIGVVALYVLVSERRQRLGDLLARTVVVAQQGPEMPADPDKEEGKK
jgi:uncharacterized RDD family membrane protein YckC